MNDHELAAHLAHEAGRLLLDLRSSSVGKDPKQLGDEGDRLSDDFLLGELARLRPNDAVLSEETADRPELRVDAERVWIVDPLDGTREYREGRHDTAVHVALWERSAAEHGAVTVGAVALPVAGVTLRADRPAALPPLAQVPRVAISRTRPPSWVGDFAERIGGELVEMGSVGYKVSAVMRGEAEAYVHTGAMSEWDSAAPVAVAAAAGLYVAHLDGSALRFNKPEPRTYDIVICRPELRAQITAALAALV